MTTKYHQNTLPILGAMLLTIAACGDDGMSEPGTGTDAQTVADMDAAMTPEASDGGDDAAAVVVTPPTPPPIVVPTPVEDSGPGPQCFSDFGAECDGDEDCSDGQVCCGTLSGATAYVSIQCQDSCVQPDGIKLCHGDEVCPSTGDAGTTDICRRSSIIPFEFLQVCAAPASVPTNVTVDTTAGKISCRNAMCQVGTEKCCIRQTFSLTGGAGTVLPPLCKPIDEDCGCDVTELTAGDAG